LFKLGRVAEARREFAGAATSADNARERAFLLDRAAQCRGTDSRPNG
jgi:predicted RNA polymerase sigma factor